MTILQPRASRVIQIIESGLTRNYFSREDEEQAFEETQAMILSLGGANLPNSTTVAAATNYLLMLWLSKGCP